jgi:ABC-type multidrug transport system ATPase subunit
MQGLAGRRWPNNMLGEHSVRRRPSLMLGSSEVVYNQEDDDHLPTLTVAQTLRFALETKTPNKKIPGLSASQFREEYLNLLLSMLNIKHTANTVVSCC